MTKVDQIIVNEINEALEKRTREVTEQVTKDVTKRVTEDVTRKVTNNLIFDLVLSGSLAKEEGMKRVKMDSAAFEKALKIYEESTNVK